MKTWKQFTFIGFLAIIAIGFAFIACDDGNDNKTPKTFTVTFNADNGSENVTQSIIGGNKATKPSNPTKEGYSFVYWYNTITNTEWDFDTAVIADLTLKAKWNEIQPILKTYDIVFKDGTLNFEVQYKAKPSATEPEYLTYLQTRLAAVVNSEVSASVGATEGLIINGGSNHTIVVEYTGNSYEGLIWNATTRTFKIHNDWISGASNNDLSLTMIRNAFNSVESV